MRVLGRTNAYFPNVWLRLMPNDPPCAKELAAAAADAKTPLDVSGQPGLWGGVLRGQAAVPILVRSSVDFERATEESHAIDLVQAHLIESLSAFGRERIDFYFVRVRRALQEYQISGVLQALEMARQDEHIGSIGLIAEGSDFAVRSVWQFHDAFDLILLPRTHRDRSLYDALAPMAQSRRVGIVTSDPLDWGGGLPFPMLRPGTDPTAAVIHELSRDHPVLVNVRTPDEVTRAVNAGGEVPDLTPYFEAYEDSTAWEALRSDPRNWVREAVDRRWNGRRIA